MAERYGVTAGRWRFYLDPLFPTRPIETCVYSCWHAVSFYWIPCKGGASFSRLPADGGEATASSSIIRLRRHPSHLTNVSVRFHIAAVFLLFEPFDLSRTEVLLSYFFFFSLSSFLLFPGDPWSRSPLGRILADRRGSSFSLARLLRAVTWK